MQKNKKLPFDIPRHIVKQPSGLWLDSITGVLVGEDRLKSYLGIRDTQAPVVYGQGVAKVTVTPSVDKITGKLFTDMSAEILKDEMIRSKRYDLNKD